MPASKSPFVLRPLEIKQLFDFAIRLYRAGFAPMFLSMAMVQLPIALIWFYPTLRYVQIVTEMQRASFTGTEPGWEFFSQHMDFFVLLAALLLFSAAYQLLVWPLGNLTCAKLATQVLIGEPWSFGMAFKYALKRYWPTQVALATYFLPLLLVAFLTLLPVAAFSAAGNDAATLAFSLSGLFLIMAGGLATWAYWFRFFPALTGIIQSAEEPEAVGILQQGTWYLKRAYGLSGGYYLRLLGLYLLMAFAIGFVEQGMSQSTQMVISMFQALMSGEGGADALVNALMATPDQYVLGLTLLIATLFALFFPPLLKCYEVLLYFDLRCRKEAFDLFYQLDTAEVAG